jgi:hypothetical protein
VLSSALAIVLSSLVVTLEGYFIRYRHYDPRPDAPLPSASLGARAGRAAAAESGLVQPEGELDNIRDAVIYTLALLVLEGLGGAARGEEPLFEILAPMTPSSCGLTGLLCFCIVASSFAIPSRLTRSAPKSWRGIGANNRPRSGPCAAARCRRAAKLGDELAHGAAAALHPCIAPPGFDLLNHLNPRFGNPPRFNRIGYRSSRCFMEFSAACRHGHEERPVVARPTANAIRASRAF